MNPVSLRLNQMNGSMSPDRLAVLVGMLQSYVMVALYSTSVSSGPCTILRSLVSGAGSFQRIATGSSTGASLPDLNDLYRTELP